MPVMNSVGIVIPNHASVVGLENVVVDICQVVTDYLTLAVHPNFSPKNPIPALLC
jgi:hypothetical protein